MSSQAKLGKDAGSVACYARERPRTQIQRRHACSCRVLSVYPDILVRQVGEEDLRLRPLAGQTYLVLDLIPLNGLRERVLVVVDRHARRAHERALDRQTHGEWRGSRQGGARGLDQPSPVGVRAV